MRKNKLIHVTRVGVRLNGRKKEVLIKIPAEMHRNLNRQYGSESERSGSVLCWCEALLAAGTAALAALPHRGRPQVSGGSLVPAQVLV